MNTPHIVIIGAGFGGLNAARHLRNAPVQITLIDKQNYHLFQPLLYQVAIAGLLPSQIAYPLRTIFRRTASDHNKGEQGPAFYRICFMAGLLEHFQQMIPRLDGFLNIFDFEALLFDGLHSKKVCLRAHCND